MKRLQSPFTTLSNTRMVFLHVALWICFLFFPLLIYKVDFFNEHFFERDLINNAFLILLFYFNFYYLIPRFFAKKHFALYFFLVLACIIVFIMQQLVVEYMFMPLHNKAHAFTPGFSIRHRFNRNLLLNNSDSALHNQSLNAPLREGEMNDEYSFFNMPAFFWIEGIRRTLLSVLTILFTGGFIQIASQWFKTEKQNEELEVKRLSVELDLLKAQINPHFLFNSLNTIYALAHKQSQQTEKVILKLSNILRYVIYDSSAIKVSLEKELAYIGNYVDLQKYRLDKNFAVQYKHSGNAESLQIEPMLLIPFIENAFKHGISYAEGSFITVEIIIEENVLTLDVNNTFNENQPVDGHIGIGIVNVKKRLDLAYKNRHQLTIASYNGIYNVHLIITL